MTATVRDNVRSAFSERLAKHRELVLEIFHTAKKKLMDGSLEFNVSTYEIRSRANIDYLSYADKEEMKNELIRHIKTAMKYQMRVLGRTVIVLKKMIERLEVGHLVNAEDAAALIA